MTWKHQKFGSLQDPIHKSDLNNITGQFGCLKAFEFGKRAQDREDSGFASGKMVAGTAAHEAIARALSHPETGPGIVAGTIKPSEGSVARVMLEEFHKAVDGREVSWGRKDSEEKVLAERVAMVTGLLCDMHNHVAEVVAVESGFIAQLGPYWLSGHIDLVYRPKRDPTSLAMCDWKTGAQLPPQVLLDHGFESGIYSAACERGIFLDRDELIWDDDHSDGLWRVEHPGTGTKVEAPSRFAAERACMETALQQLAQGALDHFNELFDNEPESIEHAATFGQFPAEMRYVHLQDYVPYSRAGKKKADRPEAVAHFGMTEPGEVKYVKGDRRGPAWYRMQRTEHDVPRLESLVRKVAGVVRMGRFFESLGEKCVRCSYKGQCLTSGYELRGDDVKRVNKALNVLPDNFDDGLGDAA